MKKKSKLYLATAIVCLVMVAVSVAVFLVVRFYGLNDTTTTEDGTLAGAIAIIFTVLIKALLSVLLMPTFLLAMVIDLVFGIVMLIKQTKKTSVVCALCGFADLLCILVLLSFCAMYGQWWPIVFIILYLGAIVLRIVNAVRFREPLDGLDGLQSLGEDDGQA